MLWDILKIILVVYVIYLLVGALLIFYIIEPPATPTVDPDDYFQPTEERVAVVDDLGESWQLRVDLIKGAQETLDISYYALHGGESVDLFIGLILEAADRGVQVRYLMDGLAHGMWLRPDIYNVLASHENIDFVFFEPLNLLKPWAFHHRMHDKIIIADGAKAMIGGRNIGDKYFTQDVPSVSIDRDILIYQQDGGPAPIIDSLYLYYNQLFTAPMTRVNTKEYSEKIAKQRQDFLNKAQAGTKETDSLQTYFQKAHEVNRAYVVSNPLTRYYKEPQVWAHMKALMEDSQESIFIQSPYIIPFADMQEDLEGVLADKEALETSLLTNAMASSNNAMGNAGYQNYRDDLLLMLDNLYEYQDPGSQHHTKAFVFDDRISALGTFNLDSRSAYLNTETMVVLDSPSIAQELKDNLEEVYGPAIEKVPADGEDVSDYGFGKKLAISLLRPIAALLKRFI